VSVTLTIDGKQILARDGQYVLEAAMEHGIEIPTFCHVQGLMPVGLCKFCIVKVKDIADFQTACMLIVREGMVVETQSPEVIEARNRMTDIFS
jgi:NADH dehydrogenase/NADH:ubiquinone oxidoreductase subunit G